MKYAIIDRPSQGTKNIIARKAFDKRMQDAVLNTKVEAIGICQGMVLEIVVASDVAEKAADVLAGELNGSCPNHMTCLVFLGTTMAVKAAMNAIKLEMGD